MTDITVTVRLFGAFRKYGENATFTVPSGITITGVKEKLADVLNLPDRTLVRDSAMANDDEIIDGDAILTKDSRLAILPPVCGG
ncbi:MAG: MoaD/ThiS family protein [Pseudomonadota bacterium]